jgi:hypothetical protein
MRRPLSKQNNTRYFLLVRCPLQDSTRRPSILSVVEPGEANIGMSALAQLDQYIKQHEVSLYSINRSVLQRNPAIRLLKGVDMSISYNSQQPNSTVANSIVEPSVEQKLHQFVVKLKEMQQIRSKQLQKVMMLFAHDMALEDECDMDLPTKAEVDLASQEVEFEAFLLGTSKEEVPPPPPPPPLAHNTLFTKQSTSSAAARSDNAVLRTSKPPHDSSLADAEEDIVDNLQKARADRTAKLQSIKATIDAMGIETSATDVMGPGAETSGLLPATRVLSTVAAPIPATLLTRTVPDYRKMFYVPAVQLRSSVTHRAQQHRVNASRGAGLSSDTARPSADVLNVNAVSFGGSTSDAVRPTRVPEPIAIMSSSRDKKSQSDPLLHSSTANGLTLQDIAEGDLYLREDAAYEASSDNRSQHIASDTQVEEDRTASAEREAAGLKPFLVSNARRRQLEMQHWAGSEMSPEHMGRGGRSTSSSPGRADLSLSTIAHASASSSYASGSGSELSGSEGEPYSASEAGSKGIGFGHRYRSQQDRKVLRQEHQRTRVAQSTRNDGVGEAVLLGSSGAAAEGSVGNVRLFDYMDAMETPVGKRTAGGGRRQQGTAGAVLAGVRAGAVAPGGGVTGREERLQRAAELASQATAYHERRLQQRWQRQCGDTPLPHHGEGSHLSVANDDGAVQGFGYTHDIQSPPRSLVRRPEADSYSSPTPTTPNVLPVFS